ncbi:ladderlectin-like [Scomber japonicus]|uniref:ladderlectin-like n=1 Tax=Scomber japonicus TaxID=13676 RepID=UPI002305B84D|nr:ladderlectin-like [Scomber japonicus]
MLCLFLFLFGLALGTGSTPNPSGDHPLKLQRGNCPMFWYSFNSRCYKYVATSVTWADAEFHCRSQKANLVSIHSMAEEKFVKSLIKNYDYSEPGVWIGFHDLYKEGRWIWSDGSALDFSHWRAHQPDNYKGYEHCAINKYSTAHEWSDVQCGLKYPSVCASRLDCP